MDPAAVMDVTSQDKEFECLNGNVESDCLNNAGSAEDEGLSEAVGLGEWQSRTVRLLGEARVSALGEMRVLVAGVGGVGGYAAEMLARSGVGHLTLIDADRVEVSNLNRQLIATLPDLGKPKVELFARRFREINPAISVKGVEAFITPDNVEEMLAGEYDYVVDAIDTVAPKVALLAACMRRGLRVISSMGAGGRVDPTKVGYMDLWSTREDGLARAVRQRLKKMGMRRPLEVVASSEVPKASSLVMVDGRNKVSSFGTLGTITAVFGILLANKVVVGR